MGRKRFETGGRERLDDLGDLPPISIDAQFDRRRFLRSSDPTRWQLAFLAMSVTSAVLVAGALWATLYKAKQPVILDTIVAQTAPRKSNFGAPSAKGDIAAREEPEAIDEAHETTMAVAVVKQESEKQIVETRPYRFVSQPFLQSRESLKGTIPPYNLANTIRSLPEPLKTSSQIYSGELNADFSVEITPFPQDYDFDNEQDIGSMEYDLSHVTNSYSDSHLEGAVNSKDFQEMASSDVPLESFTDTLYVPSNVTVLDANITYLVKSADVSARSLNTLVDLVQPNDTIRDILIGSGVAPAEAERSREVMSVGLNGGTLEAGDIVEINFGLAKAGSSGRQIERFTAYRDGEPLLSFARTDAGDLTVARPTRTAPPPIAETKLPDPGGRGSPTVYEGLYQAALTKGVPERLIGELIRAFAFEADLTRPVGAHDRIEVIFSQQDGEDRSTNDAAGEEILFAALTLNGVEYRAYRFQDPESRKVELYDKRGRSVSRLLLRKPMAGGAFRSGFGMRRHPILKTSKMHTGVDWAASRGTPIYAAGNATVSRAGWQGGFGRAVQLRLENGYEALYAHMSKIAAGIKAGSSVRQGDVIGYVGTSGLSTGNHLHYELSVNGRRVDPLRQRVPHERELSGDALRAFEEERKRIDALDETAHGDAHRSMT